MSLVAVWVVGIAGWFVSYRMGAWGVGDGGDAGPVPGEDGELMKEPVAVVGMVLGYASAVCYLWYVRLSPPFFSAGDRRPVADPPQQNPTARESRKSSKTTAKNRARASPCCSSCSR